jgi:DNA modification methylase
MKDAAPQRQWPASKVASWPIDRLKPYERNARTHSDAQIDQIAASIREWGWTMPILATKEGRVIAGHGRLVAAQRLGLASVPVMVAEGWTDAQVRAYTLADNRLALNAGWDTEILAVELDDLRDLGVDLLALGFEQQELNDLIGTPNTGVDPDETPPTPENPTSMVGDLWICGRHRVICGDATSAMDVGRLLAGVKPLLMVTDPPYGVEYDPNWRNEADRANGKPYGASAVGKVANDDRADWREAWSLFPGDVAYVWHAGNKAHIVADSLLASGFEIRAQVIWAKHRMVISRGHYHPHHEPMWYAVKKGGTGHWSGDRTQTTLWSIQHQKSDTGHGTQKPVECMRRPIENNSSPGQAVYDPFLGSGTTMIAAEQTGRACFGLELNPTYVDVIVERWQQFTGKAATLEGDGRTFEEVKRERSKDNPDAAEAGEGKSGPSPAARARSEDRARGADAAAVSV